MWCSIKNVVVCSTFCTFARVSRICSAPHVADTHAHTHTLSVSAFVFVSLVLSLSPSLSLSLSSPPVFRYEPCDHDGPCSIENGCGCVENNNFCEKHCACSWDCRNRFTGCRCKKSGCTTQSCPCFAANRECDPDLCGVCMASHHPNGQTLGREMPAPGPEVKICRNVNIQTKNHQHLLCSASKTHGWGAYAKRVIEKGQFVYEYVYFFMSDLRAYELCFALGGGTHMI